MKRTSMRLEAFEAALDRSRNILIEKPEMELQERIAENKSNSSLFSIGDKVIYRNTYYTVTGFNDKTGEVELSREYELGTEVVFGRPSSIRKR